MADDKHKRGAADRRRVARREEHEVAYFVRKHGPRGSWWRSDVRRFRRLRTPAALILDRSSANWSAVV